MLLSHRHPQQALGNEDPLPGAFDNLSLRTQGKQISKQDGPPIAQTVAPGVAEEVTARLNEVESSARRGQMVSLSLRQL
jgi:hypothetical protein